MKPPEGLQLDLLTAISRLEQVGYLLSLEEGKGKPLAMDLLESRVIECDVPRLRSYLTPGTLAWEQEINRERSQPRT